MWGCHCLPRWHWRGTDAHLKWKIVVAHLLVFWRWINHSVTNFSDSLTHWLNDLLNHWFTESLTHWITDWLTYWLADSLTHWLTDLLISWLTDSVTEWLTLPNKFPSSPPGYIGSPHWRGHLAINHKLGKISWTNEISGSEIEWANASKWLQEYNLKFARTSGGWDSIGLSGWEKLPDIILEEYLEKTEDCPSN